MATINKKSKLIASAIVVLFLCAGAVLLTIESFKIHQPANINVIKINDTIIPVDVANTPELQVQGLSGRASLAPDSGMLFVFDRSDSYQFWMKDMNFPLDMVWISEDSKVIYIKKDARPELYPETYGPDMPAKYVLEVNSGFTDQHNIAVGDTVDFSQ